MTTAHRPTWAPAKGHEEEGSNRLYFKTTVRSAKNIAGFTKLKMRQAGQSTISEIQAKDLRAELEAKEKSHFEKNRNFEDERQRDLLLIEGANPSPGVGGGSSRYDSQTNEGDAPRVLVPHAADADDSDDSASESEDDDSDDEDAALLAELARIKKEREAEAQRKAEEESKRREEERREEVLGDNPLARRGDGNDGGSSFALKRRWDDDVVFKNQAKDEPKQQKRFINDTIRSDFHRKFLERYIK